MPFSTDLGRCYAWVSDPERQGQPMRCEAPAPWRGELIDGAGRLHVVEACDEHWMALERPARLAEGMGGVAEGATLGRAGRAPAWASPPLRGWYESPGAALSG